MRQVRKSAADICTSREVVLVLNFFFTLHRVVTIVTLRCILVTISYTASYQSYTTSGNSVTMVILASYHSYTTSVTL